MSISEKAVADILRKELRLVCANNGEPCQDCGEILDDTWTVKDGNIDHIAKLIAALSLHEHSPRENPRVTDNDSGEISVTFGGKELRGWSYENDDQRRQKMLQAREYIEGWCDGREQ